MLNFVELREPRQRVLSLYEKYGAEDDVDYELATVLHERWCGYYVLQAHVERMKESASQQLSKDPYLNAATCQTRLTEKFKCDK